MPEPYEMVLGDGTNSSTYGWNLENDFFSPSPDASLTSAYQRGLFQDLATKKSAGNWNVTINDAWARALSYHFLPGTNYDNFFSNETDHGASIRLSQAVDLPSWQNNSVSTGFWPLKTTHLNSCGADAVPPHRGKRLQCQ